MSKIRQIRSLLLILLFLNFLSLRSGSASTVPALLLNRPGDGSQVTSPIQISAQIGAPDSELIRVTLVDRSGNVIARQLLRQSSSDKPSFDFSTELPFEISGETSEGLLTIALLDSYNRPISLRSASLRLLSGGEDKIESTYQTEPWLTISQPQPLEDHSGGEVRVTGTVRPLIERPVFFELVTDSGAQIGTRQLPVEQAEETLDFDISVPYAYINQRQDVRLIIRQSNPQLGEIIILDSVPIFLSP
jgi:hypothetical protein